MNSITANWLDALRDAGLGRHLDVLGPLIRPGIALRVSEEPVGASRLGGTPDLPEGLLWPSDGEGPLPFIAQLDLAELAPLDLEHQLPSAGLLSFFGGWGDDGARGCVLHLTGALASRAAPDGVETEAVQSVELTPSLELPPYSSRFVAIDTPLPVADHVRYAEVYARSLREGGRHGLLGYDRAMECVQEPNEVVLLRLDADGTIEHPFQEASVLYFLIDRAALARGEFSAARAWYGASI